MLIDDLELDYYDFVISCLDSHSDGTPFTAENPLVIKWYNAKFLQICSDKKKNISTRRKVEYIFS